MPQLIRILLGLLAAFLALTASAYEPPLGSVSVTPSEASVIVNGAFHIVRDANGDMTLSDTIASLEANQYRAATKGEANHLGRDGAVYWMSLRLRNDSTTDVRRFLEVGNAGIAHLRFVVMNAEENTTTIETGNRTPFSTRPLANRWFVFPVIIPKQSHVDIFLRVQSTNLIVSATLWEPDSFYQKSKDDYAWHSAYFGILAAMALFHLLMWVGMRDPMYLCYAVFSGLLGMALGAQLGLAKQYLWPDSPWWSDRAATVGFALTIAAFLHFIRQLLGTIKIMPTFNQAMQLYGWALLALIPGLLAAYETVSVIANGMFLLGMGLALLVTLRGTLMGNRSAFFLFPTFVLTGIGGITTVLRQLGWVPVNVFTINALQWGSLVEVVLLALALADRFNQMRQANAQAQQALLDKEQLLVHQLTDSQSILKESQFAAGIGHYEWDLVSGEVTRSDLLDSMFGLPSTRLLSQEDWLKRIHPTDHARVAEIYDNAVRRGDTIKALEYRILSPRDHSIRWLCVDATPLHDVNGLTVKLRGTVQDITELKQREARIHELAFYDALTGLANRRLFVEHASNAISACARHCQVGAVILVDLDNFKTLNDAKGHAMGDALLCQAAQRIEEAVRQTDLVARFGGDEFVVLFESIGANEDDSGDAAMAVAEKILAAIRRPFQLNGVSHSCTASLGIVLFDRDSNDVDDVLMRADSAMYQAKASGRNTARFFDADVQHHVMERFELENELRQGLALQQFILEYQAQVHINGLVYGAEVLVRWQHPVRGRISPAAFIPITEATGMVIPLGRWILECTCRQLADWSQHPVLARISLAVNISARQILDPGFVGQVLDIVRSTGANPQRLKLELTESVLIDNTEFIIEKMKSLRLHGISFSLDDFGTGFSSLSYLKKLPLNQLKIDRSFVTDLIHDPNDVAIASLVIALGKALELDVIAEGVETMEQQQCLAKLGCHHYQGYGFSRPISVAAFETLVLEVQQKPFSLHLPEFPNGKD